MSRSGSVTVRVIEAVTVTVAVTVVETVTVTVTVIEVVCWFSWYRLEVTYLTVIV